jgi:hypothetical protein
MDDQPGLVDQQTEGNCVMGKAKRRRDNTGKLTRKAWVETLMQAQAEGQKIWRLNLIPCEDAASLFDRAKAGDAEAIWLVPVISQTIQQIISQASPNLKTSPLCLLCDTLFWRDEFPPVIAVLNADRDDPTHAIVSGICLNCHAAHQDLEALKRAILTTYRTRLHMDNFRELPPFSAPGHG